MVALVVGGILVIATGLPASARTENGICESSEQCLWPLRNFQGSVADVPLYVPNYSSYNFVGPGSWAGYNLNDFSMSLRNRHPWNDVDTCMHSWFRGPCITTPPGRDRADLGEFNNEMSSHAT